MSKSVLLIVTALAFLILDKAFNGLFYSECKNYPYTEQLTLKNINLVNYIIYFIVPGRVKVMPLSFTLIRDLKIKIIGV